MISFACARCGQKLQVPNEIAGKAVRCSLCQHVMVIAAPALAAPPPSLPQSVGMPSSLARAGINGSITVEPQESDSTDDRTRKTPDHRSLRDILNNGAACGERYQVAGEIARGGMGAVLRAVDCDIRREVAVKYLLDQADPRKKARFIEEAQITGQLEHPNIVPVHELGVDADKRLFFSMKMVRGRSLAQVLRELHETPRSSEKEYTLTRLLGIFVNICHALAYAHSRGVVHRDLKPANIMIGDFGEVYVMDWGLAKVLHQETASAAAPEVIQSAPSFDWAEESPGAASTGVVQTSRLSSDDQTIDGSVLGTALYMPPEQARGEIAAIDRRSDIYSLGAVLYEMLTLHPPVERTGGFRVILGRVVRGEVVPPQQREPSRARAGKIPAELAAVAMKALAMKPEDRYQSVEDLRGDIERFLEGRSVSVKEDTKRELFIKFVKRNKGFSAGAAAALLVLLLSSIFLLQAWLATRRAYAAYQKEQEDKRAQARRSVPAFVEAARLAVQRRKFDDALAQLNVAVDYDPEHAGARLLKGQLLAARKDFAAARPELEQYVKLRPEDAKAAKLARLCAHSRPEDPAALAELADILLGQDLPRLAEGLLDAPGRLLEVHRRKIDLAWPGLGKYLAMEHDGTLSLSLSNQNEVLNLAPLQGMPLRRLSLDNSKIHDLTPLKGMPLTDLNLHGCSQITDLTPLRGMELTHLDLSACGQVSDLKLLKGMPLTYLDIGNCGQITDLSPLQGMKLVFLTISGCRHIKSLSPLKGMLLVELQMSGCHQIKDLRPLIGMPLNILTLSVSDQVEDLKLLASLPLTYLEIAGCRTLKDGMLPPIATLTSLAFSGCGGFEELTPLTGLSVTQLHILSSTIKDLTPFKNLRLTRLDINSCGIEGLTPLGGMPLRELVIVGGGTITDLTPLAGMPLTNLVLSRCGPIQDLRPLEGMPLTNLELRHCGKITDLTPLEGMKLQRLTFPPQSIKRGVESIRRMKSLETINDMPTAEFWKKYDAGAFRE